MFVKKGILQMDINGLVDSLSTISCFKWEGCPDWTLENEACTSIIHGSTKCLKWAECHISVLEKVICVGTDHGNTKCFGRKEFSTCAHEKQNCVCIAHKDTEASQTKCVQS